MSRRPSHGSRTVSDYPPSHHLPAPSLSTQAAFWAIVAGAVAVVAYPLVSLAAATLAVGTVAALRVVVARTERSALCVDVPGLPLEVTVARTAGD